MRNQTSLVAPFHRAMRVMPADSEGGTRTSFNSTLADGRRTTHTVLLEAGEFVSIQSECAGTLKTLPTFTMVDPDGRSVASGTLALSTASGIRQAGITTFIAKQSGLYRIEVIHGLKNYGHYRFDLNRIRSLRMALRLRMA